MTAPISLFRRQNHVAALAAVNVSIDDTQFPTITQCPKCGKNVLSVFFDAPADDLWLSCAECQIHGNIVSFGAQIWNIGVTEAIKQFQQRGLLTASAMTRSVGTEERRYEHATAAAAFWEMSQQNLWTYRDERLSVKLREFGLTDRDPKFKMLAGVATYDNIQEICAACQIEQPKKLKKLSDAIVLRFEYLPNKITGFLLAQYDDDFFLRQTFIPVCKGHAATKLDAGYYFLESAFCNHPRMGNNFFVVDDPLWVMRAQIAQIKYGLDFLPVCGSYHNDKVGSSGKNWAAFPPAQRFFYSKTVAADAISQAGLSRGYVATAINYKDTGTQQPAKNIKKLIAIRAAAQSWKTTLAELLKTTNLLQVRGIARRLEIPKDAVQNFCSSHAIPPPLAEQLLSETPRTTTPVKTQKQQPVIESHGQWFTGTGNMVANGIIRITHVLQADNGEQTYRGYVEIGGEKILFSENANIIEHQGLLKYVRYKAGQQQVLFTFDRRYNSRAHLIAMQIAPPKLIRVSNKLGWDNDNNEFQFGNFVITNTGDIRAQEFVSDQIPKFPAPTVVAPLTIHALLSPTHEHAAIWAGIASLVGNMTAPIAHKNFFAVAVSDGNYFNTISQLGAQLGCKTLSALSLTAVVNLANKSDWPCVVDAPYDKKRLQATIVRHQQSPLVLKTLPATAVAGLTYGWYALDGTCGIGGKDVSWLPYILPPYIQHTLRRRMALATEKSFLHGVLRDLHAWLQENYGASFNLAAATQILREPADCADAFMRFLAACVDNHELDVLPRPRRKDQEKNYLLANTKYWWINEPAINKLFAQKCGLPPDWVFLKHTLDTRGVFLGQSTVNNINGFKLNPEWAAAFFFSKNDNAMQVTYGD